KTLEYRGYDSTGAAIQNAAGQVWLRKAVGAPSRIVARLGVPEQSGQIFCGQVRWATFGAVDDKNAQPHEVRCHTHIFGAHNGNITNCDDLKRWLSDKHHQVISDNDGEMVVHTVEHEFAAALSQLPSEQRERSEQRKPAMRRAILAASAQLRGS